MITCDIQILECKNSEFSAQLTVPRGLEVESYTVYTMTIIPDLFDKDQKVVIGVIDYESRPQF